MTAAARGRATAPSAQSPFPTPLLIFLVVGLLETLLAYFMFSRADDHEYFLQLANIGVSAVPEFPQDFMDLKAKAAGLAFYVVASPSRWLGGHELTHLLWLRVLMLAGVLSGFRWFMNVAAPQASVAVRERAQSTFLILMLIYPGQLAWTASLLRDGAGTALFYFGLACLRKDLRLCLAPLLFAGCFALRPEYALILVCLLAARAFHRLLAPVRSRILLLVMVLILFSVATFDLQAESGAFAQLAFADDGFAYPLVSGRLDVVGYVAVFLQALLDPIPLGTPVFNPFYIADCAFFLYLMRQSCPLLRHRSTLVAALTVALMFGLWAFAYFEMFVGGFTRHRLSLEVGLIAMIALRHALDTQRGTGTSTP